MVLTQIRILRKAHAIIWALFLFSAISFAQAAALETPPSPQFTEARRKAFDLVWNTVDQKHFDPTFGGVDWKAMRIKYLPLAERAVSDTDFHLVLREMLGELKLSHYNIFPQPPDVGVARGVGAESGLRIIWLEDEPVVLGVDAGSPAAVAGIRPGFVIASINGHKPAEILQPLVETFEDRSLSDPVRRVMRERTLEAILSAKAGVAISVGIRDGAGKESVVELVPEVFKGEISDPVGTFPRQKVIFESKLLDGDIGYISFNMWIVPQMAKIRTAIKGFKDAKGIIFDLRGNPGGIGGMAAGVAGLLSDKQIFLGSMTSRTGSTSLIGYPQTDPFPGRVVVLTDHGSASTSEMFAAGLRESGRATLVGETTAGAILLSAFEKLPTGWIFQYVVSDYRSPKNVLIEGRGVRPDREVLLTRAALLAGRDPQLEAAIETIRSEKEK